jgi:hypothetical protein
MSAATLSWRTTPSAKGKWATGLIGGIVTAMSNPFYQFSERGHHRGDHRDDRDRSLA